jgi:hypothetical protein
MKQTKPEHNGASQLIPGVRRHTRPLVVERTLTITGAAVAGEERVPMRGIGVAVVALWSGVGLAFGQAADVRSSDVAAYMGTWAISMANPAGALETVRIWDEKGVVRASVQSGRLPAISVSGIMKDADMLILTLTRFENGKPDRAVIALTVNSDTMNMAQMLEFSQTIKRGSGKKTDQAQ